jgi:NAD(P)H-dependent flavin oxidoreductase YrpB (nitropropane dioxygenase family)
MLPQGVNATMKSPICEMLGIDFPLLAFSHCRDIVAAVSRAGGFGVLGATTHSPETIEQELKWIDDHVDGKPYGLDVLIPENISTSGEKNVTWKSLEARISREHRDFTRNLLGKHGVELATIDVDDNQPQPFDAERALELLEVSFRHPIRLIANALGVPPKAMIEMGKQHGVPVAALVGAKEHALRQVAAGVDILVAQGTEAGGHCGEVSTMVLVPEVIKAIRPIRNVPVLAAGGMHGHGRGGRLDRLGVACDGRIRDHGNLPREDDRGVLARRNPLQRTHRQAGAAATFGMD